MASGVLIVKVCNLPVDVLTYFTKSGVPSPLRFKLKTGDDESMTIKRIKVNSIKETKIRGEKIYKYTCQNIIKDKLRLYELRYNTKICKWHLFKI